VDGPLGAAVFPHRYIGVWQVEQRIFSCGLCYQKYSCFDMGAKEQSKTPFLPTRKFT
jgi:hypothetical protein